MVYRRDIDGLRAIAILAVVAFHAFPARMPGGFVGVDVFFVISGFLITGIISTEVEAGTFSARHFYARRIRRILPALTVVLLTTLALGYVLLLPDEYENLGWNTVASSLFVSNFALWRDSGYFAAGAEQNPLLHLWSLGIEEQFYVAWPVTVIALWRFRRHRLASIAAIAALSFLVNLFLVSRDRTADFYSPWSRLWELLVGGLLVISLQQGFSLSPGTIRNAASVAGMTLIFGSIAAFSPATAFPGWAAVAPTAGAALVIAAGPDAWLNRYVLSKPAAVWFGLISYSLYLWHFPLLAIANLSYSSSEALQAGIVVLAILLSWLTFTFVERPSRSSKSRAVVLISLCAVGFVAVLGASIYASDGFPHRYPKAVLEISEFRFDPVAAYRKRCSLPEDQDPVTFRYCVDRPAGVANPATIFLWGDSHAEHLYPGVAKTFGQTSTITRLTSAACPPFLGGPDRADPQCATFNAHVLAMVSKQKPDRIIIAAAWKWYNWRMLASTIHQLQSAGAKRIDVIGPVPNWMPTLKRSLINYARFNPREPFPQKRMMYGLDPRVHPLDQSMRGFVEKLDANYFSSWDVFCTSDGCLTRVGNSPTAWDYGHLTTEGSEYLVSRFPK